MTVSVDGRCIEQPQIVRETAILQFSSENHETAAFNIHFACRMAVSMGWSDDMCLFGQFNENFGNILFGK